MDPTTTPEYFSGYEWAGANLNRLRELFTGNDINTGELRTLLFEEAGKLYRSRPEDPENDFRQTLWVTGAIRLIVDKLPSTREASVAVFEVAMDLGQILNAEYWHMECLKELKAKPAAWWRKKKGDAAPDDVVAALTVGWRRVHAKEKNRALPISKWEVLVDMTGSREMCILADLRKVELVEDGNNWYYRVIGKENAFEMIMRPSYYKGHLEHGTGEIIG